MEKELSHKLTDLHYLYPNQKKVEKKAKKLGYSVSSIDRGVAHYTKGDKHIVSVKGTEPTNFKDLVSDFKIAVGLTNKDKQFKNRRKQVKEIYKTIPENHQVNLTGHSLGGSIVTSMMAKSKSIRDKTDKVDTYNAGYTKQLHSELKKGLSKEDRQELNEKILHHRVENDIVSSGLKSGSIGRVMSHSSSSSNPLTNHVIDNNFDDM